MSLVKYYSDHKQIYLKVFVYQPKYIQLGKYLKNLAQGDFGTSIKMQKNRPVIEIIKEMFPVSAKVGSLALLWAVIVGVPLGCLAAFKR